VNILMQHVEVVSHLEAAHLRQLPGLLQAATLIDGHEPLGEHKFLRLQRGGDLERAMLAFDDEQLAGYAHTVTYGEGDERRSSCELVVHPSFRRRGLGRMLLSHAMVQAKANDAHRMDLWAYNDSTASGNVAAQFGFAPARRLLHLHRHMRSTPDEAIVDGVIVRAFRPAHDQQAWLALNARVFADHPDQGQWTADDLAVRLAQPWFDAGDFLIAEREDVMVGFSWVKIEERANEGRVGEIYVIGVTPEERGRGTGAMLLARSLRRMRERQVDVGAIYVDEANKQATTLYESMGFHHHHVDVCYSRDLRSYDAGTDAAVAAA
jgi:mycothiol synthase